MKSTIARFATLNAASLAMLVNPTLSITSSPVFAQAPASQQSRPATTPGRGDQNGADRAAKNADKNADKDSSIERVGSVALLLCVGAYPEEGGLRPLPGSKLDCDNMEASLQALAYHVIRLVDEQVTPESIRSTLRLIRYPETLVVHFSGHGFAVGAVNRLALVGTQLSRIKTTTLSVDDLIAEVKLVSARKTLMSIDACRTTPRITTPQLDRALDADAISETFVPPSPLNSRDLDGDGMAVVWATGPGTRSFEDAHGGIYTQNLARALEEPEGRDVRLKRVLVRVEEGMRAFVGPKGEFQRPYLTQSYSGDPLIGRVLSRPSVPAKCLELAPGTGVCNGAAWKGFQDEGVYCLARDESVFHMYAAAPGSDKCTADYGLFHAEGEGVVGSVKFQGRLLEAKLSFKGPRAVLVIHKPAPPKVELPPVVSEPPAPSPAPPPPVQVESKKTKARPQSEPRVPVVQASKAELPTVACAPQLLDEILELTPLDRYPAEVKAASKKASAVSETSSPSRVRPSDRLN